MPRPHLIEQLKATLGTIISFTLVIALIAAMSQIVIPKNNQKEFGMIDAEANGFLGEPANTIDVLIVGDSEAYSSFSPLQMFHEQGFTSYVCASAGQQLPYSYALLARATDNQKPKIVIIETNSIYTTFSLDAAFMRILQELFPVFEYHNRWKSLDPHDFTNRTLATWTDDTKGFKVNTAVESADTSAYMEASNITREIPVKNRLYLKRMVDYCRSIGAEPILVSTPSTVNWNMMRHNGISEWAQHEGVTYLDFNLQTTQIGIDWATDTRDGGDHLNFAGATKFSTAFAQTMVENQNLPDHRDDPAYASWTAAYERYALQNATK